MKHRGCGGEMIPHGTFRLENGETHLLQKCNKCGTVREAIAEVRNGKQVYKILRERELKMCPVCGLKFWGTISAHVCSRECNAKRRIRLTEARKADEKEKITERKKKPPKPSLHDYSAAIKQYRKQTGKYLSYRVFRAVIIKALTKRPK